MPFTINIENDGAAGAAEGLRDLQGELDATRDRLREINDESLRHGFELRRFSAELLRSEQEAAAARAAMTRESFERWIGHAAHASDFTRRAFGSTFAALGQGIANELVDGTNDWRRSLQGVLRQMIALTAQMVVMRTLMSALTGGVAGWSGFFHEGGRVMHAGGRMHAGGALRAHAGMSLADDEVPIVAQRGEFILRRRAVDAIGRDVLARANRAAGGGSDAGDRAIAPADARGSAAPVFNISVTVAGETNAPALARKIGPEIVNYLRAERARGMTGW
ncbi:hypothetical protein K8I61_13925 [bacterium]|nr:hypothetical protein [bacterium]